MPADATQPRPESLQVRAPGISMPAPGGSRPAPAESQDFRFDQASRTSHSEQPVPLGGVPRAMREAAELSGLDPLAELYNEALRYATEGHLRLARERLQMLLCMAPDDGEARLMLARIFVAGQKWQDALTALDEAQSCGMPIPPSLRRAVEEHLRAEEAAAEEHRTALRAREQGEIKALRQEARRVRSENAQLVGRCADLERETRKWAWTTVGVSVVSILFIAANLFLGGRSAADVDPDAVIVEGTPAVAVDTPSAPPSTPESTATVAARAAAALSAAAGLDGTALEVEVATGKATVSGDVVAHRQLRTAESVLAGVEGIREVDTAQVQILARTRGTVHVIARGDNPSQIAQHYYGDVGKAKAILAANKGATASNLRIGQELKIPPVDR